MAYTPNIWVDREGTTRYFETVDNDGALIFTPDYTQVTEMGTPVNADNMNHIEEGIAAGSFTKYKLTTTYAKDDLVTAIVDNELKVYKSLQDNNTANALDNTNFWEEVEFAGGGGGTYAMFDPVIKDHVLTYEESKGLELQGTYVYKTAIAGSRYGYPDFYAKCLEEKSQATATSTTLGGTAITLYIHANGHTYYDIANKSIVDTFYNSNGIAWFYGIDTANQRIFLPRNDYFFQLTGDTSEVNEYVSAGLPNITGSLGTFDIGDNRFTGAFKKGETKHANHGIASNNGRSSGTATFDASRSSAIYGNSSTVQPPASKKLLYICVGNTESDTSWIDVVTQVEGGVKDLEDKTNEGLSALANASNALRTTQITNCITEIPQRIKLELADGTLTLKAGSTVIVPNGANKFNEVVIASDISVTSNADRNCFFFVNSSKTMERFPTVLCYSGATAPTSTQQYMMWYDTTNNVVKKTTDNGATWTSGISLPIGLFTEGASGIKSIDQVFNGFGYIGSTVWADKGVKGLAPNGRNEDGTLNNRELDSPVVRTVTVLKNQTDFSLVLNNDGLYILAKFNTVTTGTTPTSYGPCYVEETNKAYNNGQWRSWVHIATYSTDSTGNITSFNTKLPFRAVDYNDYINTPHITEPYVSGTSGYNVYSNKYCEQWGQVTSSGTITFLKSFKDKNYSLIITPNTSTGWGQGIPLNQMGWTAKTATGFTTTADVNCTKEWRACGYIA